MTHYYRVCYPAHGPRESDPHYIDFEHYRKSHIKTAKCFVGERVGFEDCYGGLELHHAHIEFALLNEVSFEALEKDFPGISDPSSVGAWVESDQNLQFLCAFHHRFAGGAHNASHADFEGELYVKHLIEGDSS